MKSLKQMFRRMKIRYLFMLGALAATCSIGWAVQYRGEDWNTVASFDELVQR